MSDAMTSTATGANHIEAIDGLRAVAVAAVLVFHADLGIAPGGFLGVSLFFTLSGYLITSLLLREHAAQGTISIKRFYARRWRRLVPSAWVTLALVLAAAPLWSVPQVRELPGDALAVLANVANWRAAFADLSYQDLFIGQPSPLAHFWSLAIEEQFYAVMPLIALLALRRSRRTLSVVVSIMLAGSVVATALTNDRDLVYNGTHTRAAELLIGVLLAIHAPTLRRVAREVLGWVALAAFGLVVTLASIGDNWIYRGGLAAFSLISAALVVAALGPPRTLFSAVLGARPLVAIGRWSYALYLIHWPIYLALNEARTGLNPVPLFAVRTALALALAALITTVVERPIRTRRIFTASHTTFAASLVAAVCLVVGIVVLPRPELSENEQLLAAGESGQITFTADPEDTIDTVDAVTTTTARPRPVLVVGSDPAAPDELRLSGLAVVDGTNRHCPLVDGLEAQLPTGEIVSIAGCLDPTAAWIAMARASQVTDVVVTFGAIDEAVTRTSDEVGFPTSDELAQLGGRWNRVLDKLAQLSDAFPPDLHLHLLYDNADRNYLLDALTRFSIERSRLASLHTSIDDLANDMVSPPPAESSTVHVLVVGDSTSVILAQALFRAGDGNVDVRWVGANGCPFVNVRLTRASSDLPWDTGWCRSMAQLVDDTLTTFTPDVVVVMVAHYELRHQQYPGDDRDHVAGDAAYTQFHDDYMRLFDAPLALLGIPLLVADCPQIRTGQVVNEEMASPERIAAWNEQVQRWVGSSSNIELLPYAAAINEYEATIGEALFDGSHADVDILTQIMRDQLLDVILSAAHPR